MQTTIPSSGSAVAEALEPGPGLRAEHGEVDDDGAQAHRDDGIGRDRAREHAVLPAEAVQALAEDLDEAAVAIEDGDPQGRRSDGAGLSEAVDDGPPIVGAHACRHRGAV